MPGVFICYRRGDTGGEAGRVYDRLSTHFGSERVFRDVDTIGPGDLFPRAIGDRLSRCNVVLALIGPRWLRAGGEATESRLDDPDDFVRIELATAIRRRIPVIPALFRNARMPEAAELPSDLAPLASCQAIQIHDADFHADVTRLIAVLKPMVPPASEADGASASATLRAQRATLSAEEVRAIILRNDFFSSRINPAGSGTGSTYTVEVIGDAAVVMGRTSGLMWEQGGSGRPVSGGLAGAFEYVADLNREAVGGFRDWRLPALEEALALLTSRRPTGLPPAAPVRRDQRPIHLDRRRSSDRRRLGRLLRRRHRGAWNRPTSMVMSAPFAASTDAGSTRRRMSSTHRFRVTRSA